MSRQKDIADLWLQGYSPDAIACRLDCPMTTVRLFLNYLGFRERYGIPPGYYTVRQEAERIGFSEMSLANAIRAGELRCVHIGRLTYIKREWTDIWLNNEPYRKRAREMQRKLFRKGQSKPD